MKNEEAWRMYKEALIKAEEEYKSALCHVRRKPEGVDKLAYKKYKEAIEKAQGLIRGINWDSEDEFHLKSY